MLLYTLVNLLAALSAVSCTPLVLHESRSAAPSGFSTRGAAPDSDLLTLKFALTPNNLSGLEAKLKSISTPGSPDFRQWLSKDEVKAFVQPSDDTVAAFNSWASANGVTPSVVSANGDWVSLTLNVAAANKLLGASFQMFTHRSLAQPITRTLSISLPSELIGHVEVIHPSTSFSTASEPQVPRRRDLENRLIKRDSSSPSESSSLECDGLKVSMTPPCLQKLYGIPSTPATQQTNTLLIPGYWGINPNWTDLSSFLEEFRPDIPSDTHYDFIQIGNNTVELDPLDFMFLQQEANADIEYAASLATGVPVQFLSVGASSDELDGLVDGMLDTTIYLQGLDNPPSVVSTSFAPTEADFEESIARKLCNSYLALGARGISMMFCSGDGGVRGGHDDPTKCSNNDFLMVFPASCPWVTAVGATQGIQPEVATNLTGGGFSGLFPRPWYQEEAAENFLKTIPADFPGKFNRSGRAFPDVSAQGGNLLLMFNGTLGPTAGTSLSTPIFAAQIALINDRLVAAGKPVLGFLNPWIYENTDAFTDITEGHNSGFLCPKTSVAFDATKGWDPLTGVGSPVFDKLLAAALEA
ncbi:family S53 protease-like protein [Favolaschia claudopus]|uniref:tripeptidyl-peptidase II n=1 Tax=Favolaschia claudopus TaxID=2862362 RepID=A0AAW0A5Y9_9AGAR